MPLSMELITISPTPNASNCFANSKRSILLKTSFVKVLLASEKVIDCKNRAVVCVAIFEEFITNNQCHKCITFVGKPSE